MSSMWTSSTRIVWSTIQNPIGEEGEWEANGGSGSGNHLWQSDDKMRPNRQTRFCWIPNGLTAAEWYEAAPVWQRHLPSKPIAANSSSGAHFQHGSLSLLCVVFDWVHALYTATARLSALSRVGRKNEHEEATGVKYKKKTIRHLRLPSSPLLHTEWDDRWSLSLSFSLFPPCI